MGLVKFLVLILAIVLAPVLVAQDKTTEDKPPEVPKSFEVNDTWGSFKLEFSENVEPIWYPIAMSLKLLCKDQRKTPGHAVPEEIQLPIHDRICEFEEHAFDDKEKVLRLKYTIYELEDTSGECTKEINYKAELKTLCRAWAQ